MRNDIASILRIDNGRWRHPWHVRPMWNAELKRWDGMLKSGLVNSADVTIRLPYDEAPAATIDRLKLAPSPQPEASVDCRLVERAGLPLTSFRALGPDADPTGASVTGEEIKLSYEDVPLFFQARGVGSPPAADGDITKVTASGLPPRLLRSLDIVLAMDRPATTSTVQQSTGEDGIMLQYSVGLSQVPNARKQGYLRTTSKFTPPRPPDAMARLLGDWNDTTRDELLMATVFFMSLPGAAFGSAVDETWQPFVQHRVFWNLRYGFKDPTIYPPDKPLTLNTGLAAGLGDQVNNYLLAQINDANSAALNFLRNTQVEGRFWTA